MRGLILIGITAVGTAIYGINQVFKKYATLDIGVFLVIFVLIFGTYRLTVYALKKGGKHG